VDSTEILSFTQKSLLAGDLNAKYSFWNIVVSNPSDVKCPIHYTLAGNGDIFYNIVHKNVRLSVVIVSDILDSDHLPIIFPLLDHVTTKNLSGTVDKFTDWELFKSLASELISPRIQINSGEEADKVARDFTVCIASVYGLSTSKLTLSDQITIYVVWRFW
jgi:hypothetical protein